MKSFLIQKSDLKNNFTGIFTPALGEAAGCLKFCGLKLYLYLAGNKNGTVWTVNPAVFAEWLGVNYRDSSTARAVRKVIQEGTEDLIKNGYLEVINDEMYKFLEQKVPEN